MVGYGSPLFSVVAAIAAWHALHPVIGAGAAVAISAALAVAMVRAVAHVRTKPSSVTDRGKTLVIGEVLEDITDCFCTLDAGWRVTYVNSRAADAFGRPADALVGRSLWQLLPGHVGGVLERSLRDAVRERRPVRFEAPAPSTHGRVEIHAYPSSTGLAMLFHDPSEHLAFQLGEERTKAILRSASDAIITIDESGRITLFSAGAERIFGCSASDAVGHSIEKLIPAGFREADQGHTVGETGVGTPKPEGERVLVGMRASGEEFPMEARTSESTVAGEKLYTVILRDVTERMRIEREREELLERARNAAAEAERANRAKDDFLAMVSHELRTPLTPLLAWATMLRTRAVDAATTTRALETIERAARSQARLVEDLLDVSRIVAGKLRLEVRYMELAPAIAAAVESLRPAAEAKGVVVHTHLDALEGFVSGDRDRLQQVVSNLVSNAIKFTARGGRVDVVLRRVGSHLEFAVRDNGMGIDPAFVPHVFERFRQFEVADTRAHGGLGLGLAIVRHIVELHGGTVACESDGPGRGAAFIVRLHVASRTALAPLGAEASRRDDHVPAAASPAADRASLAGVRVLVVDDDPDTLDILGTILAAEGMAVRTLRCAREALAMVRTWRPDVLVSDIGMPEEDGYALIRRIRTLPSEEGGAVPAIALTAYARYEDRHSILSAGFQMHAAKPIDPAELLVAVSRATEMAR